MKRWLPNGITALRIPCALGLLAVAPFGAGFWVLYGICGVSDVLDGWLARRWGTAGRFGARLDSAADTVFTACLLILYGRTFVWQGWMLCAVAAVALVRFAALAVCRIRFGVFAFLHTLGNKAAGLGLFAFPLLCTALGFPAAVGALCVVATLSAVEELFLQLRLPALNLDVKGLFFR